MRRNPQDTEKRRKLYCTYGNVGKEVSGVEDGSFGDVTQFFRPTQGFSQDLQRMGSWTRSESKHGRLDDGRETEFVKVDVRANTADGATGTCPFVIEGAEMCG